MIIPIIFRKDSNVKKYHLKNLDLEIVLYERFVKITLLT